MNIILALLGALLVAFGVALIFVPAGVIVAGLALISAAYVKRYLEAQHETSVASSP